MIKIYVIIMLFIVAQCFADKTVIAVNDLSGQGVDSATSMVITERIRAELTSLKHFRVMERSQMQVILREQGFQSSGACSDNDCLVQMGQLLGVENMLVGTIGKIGNIFTISLRMVDVRSGEVLYTVTEDCRCAIEDVLTVATPNIINKLKNIYESKFYGTVTINTEPQFAHVTSNGDDWGISPTKLSLVKPGKYDLLLDLYGYDTVKSQINVTAGKNSEVLVKMVHSKSWLDSMQAVNITKSKKNKFRRKVVMGILSIAASGASAYLVSKSNEYSDKMVADEKKYLSATNQADIDAAWADYESSVDDFDKSKTIRNISFGVTGLCLSGFVLTFVF
ncbi:MAG: PEGA domain-containing protein [Fibrobacteres bacterium]|nr:PEGA domain-containing protein [Fibrobacterota bacterium]